MGLYIGFIPISNSTFPDLVVLDSAPRVVQSDDTEAGSAETVVSSASAALGPSQQDSAEKVEPKPAPQAAVAPAKAAAPTSKTVSGQASYYDYVTKSGFSSKGKYVCAVRHLPRGSHVRVTNTATGKSVDCKVTDYGPDASVFPERVVDLSSAAFAAIGSTKLGVLAVKVEEISQ